MSKRAMIGLLAGAVLGVFCIVGLHFRMGSLVAPHFLFATWFNRVLMGLLIGFYTPKSSNITHAALRGGVLGLAMSFSLYTASGFIDTPGFMAGIVYGVIIDIICTKYAQHRGAPVDEKQTGGNKD